MAKMKGGELIAEYLVQAEGAVHLRHLRPRQRRHPRPAPRGARQAEAGLAAPRAVRRPHGRRLLPRQAPAGGDAHLDRPGLGEPGDVARHRAVGFVGVPRHHLERADLAGEPRAVPGDLQAQPVGFPLRHAPGGEARLPAHARGHAAARAAPGLRHHGHRPPGTGEHRRALQRVPGGGRRRAAAALARVRPAPAGRFRSRFVEPQSICWRTPCAR